MRSILFVCILACVLLGSCLGLLPAARFGATLKRGGLALAPASWPTSSLPLADGGLDGDTLGALGDIRELNEALDGAIDAAGVDTGAAMGDVLMKVVASPYIIAVPILAGLGVAFAIGFFIFSWGSVKDD